MEMCKNVITFSSGNSFYACGGTVGIAPNMEAREGYDGILHSDRLGDRYKMDKEDRIELADYMINQWQKFKALAYDE